MTTEAPAKTKTATPEKEKDYGIVAVSVPQDLREQVEKQSASQKLSVGVFVRRLIAEHFKYDIRGFEAAHRRGRVKYATEAERLEAIQSAQRERAELVAALLARYNKGEIEVSDTEREAARQKMRQRKHKAS